MNTNLELYHLFGNILYAIEHMIEAPVHQCLYGQTRFSPNSPWWMKCMESRMWHLLGEQDDRLRRKCALCYTYLEMSATAPEECNQSRYFKDFEFPGLVGVQHQYIKKISETLKSGFNPVILDEIKQDYLHTISALYGVKPEELKYIQSGICGTLVGWMGTGERSELETPSEARGDGKGKGVEE